MTERMYRKVQNRRLRRFVCWLLRQLVNDLNALLKEGLR
jgi:hypothetical protein